MTSLCTEIKKLKGAHLSESFQKLFTKNNSLVIESCPDPSNSTPTFSNNSNTPTKKIPDNSPYYNIAGYMTQLFIYDMLFNQQYIQYVFPSNKKIVNSYNSQDLLRKK